ncbi:hypothetical protein SNE40_010166 [Patella caerulea]|uniref:Uncharacterized protein n=1 Tax=Patella caerulea TaxID=87958 RepID=A0AAN8JTW1_PATCE
MLKLAIVCAAIAFVAAQPDGPTPPTPHPDPHPHPTPHPHPDPHSHPTPHPDPHSHPTPHPDPHPHPTHPPHVDDTFHFFNDRDNNKMAIKTRTACYIFTLTADQQQALLTPDGIQATELALIGKISTGTKTQLTHEDMHDEIAHHCGHENVFAVSQ